MLALRRTLIAPLLFLCAFSYPVVLNAQDNAAIQPIERKDANSVLAHQQLLEKVRQGKIDLYFVGDSITRRWGATDYPELLKHWNQCFYGWNAANFGWGGDTTQNILWRLQHGELDGISPKVVVLQAGTNNLPWRGPAREGLVEEVVQSLQAIISTVHQKTPHSTIILTSLFPRDQNPALLPMIEKINQRLANLSNKTTIRFLNINDDLVDSEGKLLPGMSNDGLHLTVNSYQVWANALSPLLHELLGPPASDDFAPSPTGDPSARTTTVKLPPN
ncbi:MAG: hypothetical protein KDB03_17725 [Planctomycetales bacterium]|nr:hypothetical protein [Planctomycetales bacterium]